MTQTTGIRAARKARVREALVEEALTRFEAEGYEAVTVDAIAEAVGVSRRTVFRYFGGKDGLIFARPLERLEAFRALLADPLPDEAPQALVRRALLLTAADFSEERAVLLREFRVIQASPELVGRELEIDLGWEEAIGEALARALPARRAELVAGAMMGLIRATIRRWYAGGCEGDLVEVGRAALELVAGIDDL
jgi:AcrR family transcriptional regulator